MEGIYFTMVNPHGRPRRQPPPRQSSLSASSQPASPP
ncbi:IclR family transcriptional regulator, partial [Burkholderia mallei]